ncbi:hypothetical protein [Brunnivagina elsteri]|uniref:Uncharacterized protein n=1 Tax=Brunnivagina elsteri CCALA 953 TaxID=987040 RepID=A0A2A2TKU8_9CYAN|nr:hypothetical protein [Calothrix elsteri]PAX55881.1 hypothetical protein CK510_10900 [Calothrix elsteri CCALA 953]
MSNVQIDDAYTRGVEYLEMVRCFVLEPRMVDVLEPGFGMGEKYPQLLREHRTWGYSKGVGMRWCKAPALRRSHFLICNWIGENIDTVNAQLNTYLQACHECFHPQERRDIRVFAVPLAQSLGIDGFCNILIVPTTILIDVGRVAQEDWLSLVAHEYAHAHVGTSGHNQQFASILCHLCLGLGLEPPTWEAVTMESSLRTWPYCKSTINPLGFWIGEG